MRATTDPHAAAVRLRIMVLRARARDEASDSQHATPVRRGHPSETSLARRISVGFGSVASLAVILLLALVVLVSVAASAVTAVRRDERIAHDGLMLGVAVREQYMHEAHTLIEENTEHIGHHGDWVARVRADADRLADMVPSEHRWRVDRIARTSAMIDHLFHENLVPAMQRRDHVAVEAGHRRVDSLVALAAADADTVATALEQRMRDAQRRAERATTIAWIVAAVGALLTIALAGWHAWRLRRSVLQPLASLAEAARHLGQGDVPAALSIEGEGEIRAARLALARMVEDLRARTRALVEAERLAAIGELAAGVAHEVNNPIGIIRGYLRTMIPEARDEEQRAELEILDEEARACQRIVEDLLSFARAGELERTRVDAARLIRDTVHRLQESGELGAAEVRVSASECGIEADPIRLRQVLANLVRNAAQHTSASGGVEVRGAVQDTGYRFEVIDEGSGLSEEDLTRVFEPFWSKRRGGSGLGLAVSAAVVRAHGGAIRAERRDGGGARFIVELPLSGMQVSP